MSIQCYTKWDPAAACQISGIPSLPVKAENWHPISGGMWLILLVNSVSASRDTLFGASAQEQTRRCWKHQNRCALVYGKLQFDQT